MNARMRWMARIVLAALVAMSVVATMSTPAEAKSKYRVSIGVSASGPVSATVTGDVLSFKGKVAGKTKKRKVYLQVSVAGGAWHTTATVKTSKHGYWAASVALDQAGERRYRVYKPAERYHKKAYSKTVTVSVGPKVTTVVTVLPHDLSTIEDSSLSACSAHVIKVPGTDGSQTDTYADGVLVKTDIVDPVTEVDVVGTSPDACVIEMSPEKGSANGGTSVTVTGKNLSGTTAVMVGGSTAEITRTEDAELVFTVPAGDAGDAEVDLVSEAGILAAGTFTYLPPPTISSLSSTTGSLTGGETVSIFGANLDDITAVTFTPTVTAAWTTSGDGSMPAVPALKTTAVSGSQLDVVVPPGLGGASTLTVTGPNGKASTTYTYVRSTRDASDVELAFLARVNEYRAQGYDCGGAATPVAGPLAWDGELADFAMGHTADVLQRTDLYPAYSDLHLYPGLTQWSYRLPLAGYGSVGEVLQRSISTSTSSTKLQPRTLTAVDGQEAADIFMMQSVGHCKILMNQYANYLGAGITAASITDHSYGVVTTADVRA